METLSSHAQPAMISPHIYSNRAHRIAVAAFFFILGFCFASWASRIPVIQQKLGLSDAQLGIVLFALPVGLFITQ